MPAGYAIIAALADIFATVVIAEALYALLHGMAASEQLSLRHWWLHIAILLHADAAIIDYATLPFRHAIIIDDTHTYGVIIRHCRHFATYTLQRHTLLLRYLRHYVISLLYAIATLLAILLIRWLARY